MRLHQLVEHRCTWRVLIGAPFLACLLIVSGCSAKFFYNRLDTFASWYFESLVSLNDAQRSELRTWLENTLAWHRESELTRYAEFVADVSATAAQPSSRDTYEALRVRFEGLINSLVAKTAPEAAELLVRLSPQQVDELIANLDEKSRKSAKESAEAVARNTWQPRQTKGFIKQFKRWTGNVTPQQKEMIAATIARLEPTYEDWAASQHAWREALRQTLLNHAASEGDTVPPRLLSLLEDPDQRWTPAYSAKVARNRERYEQLLIDLDASLSAEQRAHLRKKLDELATTLTRLAQG
jgi:hypothetical protein